MKKIAITGGLGSGKSTFCKILHRDYGIPIFVADERAKNIVLSNVNLQQKLSELVGFSVVENEKLQKVRIAEVIFHQPQIQKAYERLVHEALRTDYQQWLEAQSSSYILYEAAILFEKGNPELFDITLLICSENQTRIERVMSRENNLTKTEIEQRMALQWSDEKKKKLADLVIYNYGNLESLTAKAHRIHQLLS